MKKRILIIMYVLLLCVTVSFAWLSNVQENINNSVDVDFGVKNPLNNATIVDTSFLAHLESKDANGEYKKVEGPYSFDSKAMVPGARIPFKLKIKNMGDAEKKVTLSLDMRIDDFDPNEPNILDMLYIDIVLAEGFDGSDVRHIFKKLSDFGEEGYSGNGDFSLNLYGYGEELSIALPEVVNSRGGTDGYVTLNCSFYYDQNATAEYQDNAISGLSFRLE